MTQLRSLSLLLAAAVLSLATVACSTDAEDGTGSDPTATAPSTSTRDGDTPSASDGTATTTPDGTATATPDGSTSTTPDGTASTTPDGTPQTVGDERRVVVEAPIEEIEVLFLESFPVQHRLRVVSGLPSGCAAFDGIEVVRDGTMFTVTVTNTMPAPDQDIACTMIYGYHESTVDLGNDLESGIEYTVYVNDKVTTFVAQ